MKITNVWAAIKNIVEQQSVNVQIAPHTESCSCEMHSMCAFLTHEK